MFKWKVILNKLQDTELEAAKHVEYNYIYRDTHQQKNSSDTNIEIASIEKQSSGAAKYLDTCQWGNTGNGIPGLPGKRHRQVHTLVSVM